MVFVCVKESEGATHRRTRPTSAACGYEIPTERLVSAWQTRHTHTRTQILLMQAPSHTGIPCPKTPLAKRGTIVNIYCGAYR